MKNFLKISLLLLVVGQISCDCQYVDCITYDTLEVNYLSAEDSSNLYSKGVLSAGNLRILQVVGSDSSQTAASFQVFENVILVNVADKKTLGLILQPSGTIWVKSQIIDSECCGKSVNVDTAVVAGSNLTWALGFPKSVIFYE